MKKLADGRVLGIGYVIAKMNKTSKPRRRTVLPVQRTIDISNIPDHLLYFWSEKHRKGTSCKEIGHAYGMNGHQMRSAIAQWRKKNEPTQPKLGKMRSK